MLCVILLTSLVKIPPADRLRDTAVAKEAERLVGQFAHQPPIVVRQSAEGVLEGATRASGIMGAVHKGRIYLFLDRIASLEDVRHTLFHELFHYGLRRFMLQLKYRWQKGCMSRL